MAAKKSGMTQRSLNALETKNKLFSTALMLFTKHGFNKVTVDDITRYAGVSKGTFYNHFSTKDEVLVEQFNKIDGHYEQVFRHMKPEHSASERILIFASGMCEYCADIWGLNLLKIVYINQISFGSRPNILGNKKRPFYTIMMEIVRQGQESGEFATHIPLEDQVDLFARTARSILYEWCLHDGSFDLKDAAYRSFRFALASVSTDKYRQALFPAE